MQKFTILFNFLYFRFDRKMGNKASREEKEQQNQADCMMTSWSKFWRLTLMLQPIVYKKVSKDLN